MGLGSNNNFSGAINVTNGATLVGGGGFPSTGLNRNNTVSLTTGAFLSITGEAEHLIAGLNGDATGTVTGYNNSYGVLFLAGTGNYNFPGVINGSVLRLYMSGSPGATQTLSGANVYQSDTWLTGGTLHLDFSAVTAQPTNILYNGIAAGNLILGGGKLSLTGSAALANTQTFGLISSGNSSYAYGTPWGASRITLTSNGHDVALSTGNILQGTGGAIDFVLPAGAQTATNGVLTTAANDATGILGGYATVSSGATTDFATVVGGTHQVPGTTAETTTGTWDQQAGFAAIYSATNLSGPISFNTIAGSGSGLTAGTLYYVASSMANPFGPGYMLTISATPGGTLIAATGTGGTLSIDTQGNVEAYTAYTPFAGSGDATTANALVTGSGSMAAAETINTLKIVTTAAGQTLALTGQLSLNGKGLLFNGANDYTISGGTLYGNGDLTLEQYGTGNLTVTSNISTDWGGSFTKTGPGTLTLVGANSITGVLHLNQGIVNINTLFASGTGNLRGGIDFNGGTLQYASTFTGSGDITTKPDSSGYGIPWVIIQSGGATIDTNGNNIGYAVSIGGGDASGLVSGTGYPVPTGGLTKAGLGTLKVAPTNAYAGPTIITGGGTLSVGSLVGQTLTGNTGSLTDLTLTQTTGLAVGQAISGGSIAPGTTIAAIVSGTDITLSQPATIVFTPLVAFDSNRDLYHRLDDHHRDQHGGVAGRTTHLYG